MANASSVINGNFKLSTIFVENVFTITAFCSNLRDGSVSEVWLQLQTKKLNAGSAILLDT